MEERASLLVLLPGGGDEQRRIARARDSSTDHHPAGDVRNQPRSWQCWGQRASSWRRGTCWWPSAALAQGPLTNPANEKGVLPDLKWSEISMLVPLVLLFFALGLFPNLLLNKN
ncbi:MAG: hypothetical protein R2873_05890 [Caldilineaceae bacterium]